MTESSESDSGPPALRAVMPPEPDFSQLPVVIPIGSTPLFGVALIVAGAIFPVVVFLILSLIGLAMAEKPAEWFWIKTIFSLIPILVLPWGWWVLRSRTTVEIGEETVRRVRKTPLGTSGWTERRAAFNGLAFTRVLPRASSGVDRFPRWVVVLDHPDRARATALTYTEDQAKAREVLDGLVRLTGMPVVVDESA